jgi:hypothetical protein
VETAALILTLLPSEALDTPRSGDRLGKACARQTNFLDCDTDWRPEIERIVTTFRAGGGCEKAA